jgi:hypothetical protein
MSRTQHLEDTRIPVRIKLAALWASAMSCYIYGDYFWLYQPGKLQSMLAGRIVPLGAVTQAKLLATTVSMAIPSSMIFLSLVLPPALNRRANIVLGALYTVFVLVTMRGAWVFYLFLGAMDMMLTAAIVWHAWTWPRTTRETIETPVTRASAAGRA